MTNRTSTQTYSGLEGTEAAISDGEASSDVNTDVIVAVAEADGVDPVEMDERLHDWIDPDALEAVVGSIEAGHVEFVMADHRVRVRSDGHVSVDRAG